MTARNAAALWGGTPIDKTLRSVRLRPEAAAETARSLARSLARLGMQDTLDLQLLAGGPEAEELLSELKSRGLGLGDRAKMRLLIGDRAHSGRLFSTPVMTAADPHQQQQQPVRSAWTDEAAEPGWTAKYQQLGGVHHVHNREG